MYLLDTDHLTILERGGNVAQRLRKRLSSLTTAEIGVTIITYEEQTRGWLGYIAKTNSVEQQIIAYSKLEKHIATFSKITIVGFDDAAATIFKQYRANYPRLGTMDLKIAAIAISRSAILLTRNLSDFGKISNLQVEDWTN
ncbi:type II toxin-antitoxin system VapC family toxin [Aetokthonos hydrillicola Thurmond2011]|jgi:tRNA(fMet)-specific endonuclease VapC|uniref:Type II toxin-antitoxin system VapC family toxin n=1 Tax=Aetokthonos hydrillicola Thurmond2011 TaxID=2712845 RepID=A0AAP5I3T8_9CYAN|nr:type II toxin-antitoxin system VapC family toxin [Aetokthonos hydrillicola]MBO3458585.1 type II toxin-antitoxin system VapC family toxin [Aetokthonos hydrillicola CCALA 1050]MBW4585028.1 type II toxin-antitoxin system VapC family toxin [Aetokthonos hydrillicola CCALA 1050]MDR9894211.1 type II toxin-antitoxin system VapC family toxin [Aetokthonos hydrillicola Thurmond2011]